MQANDYLKNTKRIFQVYSKCIERKKKNIKSVLCGECLYQIYYVKPFSIEKGAVIYGSLLGAMIEADEIAFGECPNADIYLVKVDGFPFAPTFCFPVAARYLISSSDVLKYEYHKCPVLLGYDYGLELEVIKDDGELWRYSNWVFPF